MKWKKFITGTLCKFHLIIALCSILLWLSLV